MIDAGHCPTRRKSMHDEAMKARRTCVDLLRTPSLAGTVALKSVRPFRADYLRTHRLSLPQPHELLLLLLCFDHTADGVSATSSLLSACDRHLRMSHFDIVRRPQLRRRR